jgi:hypothetical protein
MKREGRKKNSEQETENMEQRAKRRWLYDGLSYIAPCPLLTAL